MPVSPLNTQFTSCGQSDNLRMHYNLLRAALVASLTGAGLISTPVLAEGTSSKADVKCSGFNFRALGFEEAKVGAETSFTDTTHDVLDPDALARGAIFVLSIAQGGTITITKGADALAGSEVAPATPANECKMGEVLVQHNGTAIFNANSDLLDAAHLTVVYPDAALLGADVLALTS